MRQVKMELIKLINALGEQCDDYELDKKITHLIKIHKCEEETALRALIRYYNGMAKVKKVKMYVDESDVEDEGIDFCLNSSGM